MAEDCERCGHDFGPHEFRSDFTAPQFGFDVPVAGWVTCPEPDCVCWSTWSIKHPDMPPALTALIDEELARIRRAHEAEGDEIVGILYEDALIEGEPWALEAHNRRFPPK